MRWDKWKFSGFCFFSQNRVFFSFFRNYTDVCLAYWWATQLAQGSLLTHKLFSSVGNKKSWGESVSLSNALVREFKRHLLREVKLRLSRLAVLPPNLFRSSMSLLPHLEGGRGTRGNLVRKPGTQRKHQWDLLTAVFHYISISLLQLSYTRKSTLKNQSVQRILLVSG